MMRWVLMILGCMASDAWSANQVVWYPKARTFDLRVKDVPLEVFLGMVKAETGWEVKVEPGLQQIVSGKFRNKPAADAIRLMLGRVRFAFLPRLEGGTRLLVYAGNTRSATQSVAAVEQAAADNENPDEALIHLPVKIHYLKSRYVSINADTKLTNLRPLFAGANEIWGQGKVRFAPGRPEQLSSADTVAEKEFADLFKPSVPSAYVRLHQSRILHRMIPDFPDRGKVFRIIVLYTMPDAFGAVYMPKKGVVLMPQVKFAGLIDKGGVWKDGSPIFFAQSNILAHELGHALGLPHVATQGNLMIDGRLREGSGVGPGTKLTEKQIETARAQGKTGGPRVPGLNPKTGD